MNRGDARSPLPSLPPVGQASRLPNQAPGEWHWLVLGISQCAWTILITCIWMQPSWATAVVAGLISGALLGWVWRRGGLLFGGLAGPSLLLVANAEPHGVCAAACLSALLAMRFL